jgi:hypothetical protein
MSYILGAGRMQVHCGYAFADPLGHGTAKREVQVKDHKIFVVVLSF